LWTMSSSALSLYLGIWTNEQRSLVNFLMFISHLAWMFPWTNPCVIHILLCFCTIGNVCCTGFCPLC
jgi:hypothetical protein